MSLPKGFLAFAGAVVLQLAILAAVPAQKAYTLQTGRTVLLKTAPVDPYSIMSGYYVTLRYEISRADKAAGWADLKAEGDVYVVLKEDDDGTWSAESVHDRWPDVPEDRVVIKGTGSRYGLAYGIETYYIPETMRETIEKDLRANQPRARFENGRRVEPTEAERQALDPVRIEARVDRFGHAALVRLHIGPRIYDY